ncbi:MAG: DNA polymerase III subunit delta' [Candidatus Omnitrophota bacterium]|nr:DNA polymerase III subunit delta' [Candidatus Omnitrophota bacterium]
MLLLSDIKGQSNAIRFLSNSLSTGRIANSYLFFGPRGVGRALCAKAFLMGLICGERGGEAEACGNCDACHRVNALGHPDISWIKPEKNKAIKIEQIRGVKDTLNMKPYESSISACVIEDAHMMTKEASNALLKILEEPPGRSLLILITDKREMLLETVVSRCAEVRFRPLPVSEAREIIMRDAADLKKEEAHFLAYFSQGSPGRALEMLEEGVIDRKTDLMRILDDMLKEENISCLNWDTENRDQLIEDLELLVMFLRDVAMGKEDLEDMVLDKGMLDTELYGYFKKYPVDKLYGIVERLGGLKTALEGNVNPRIVAQALPGMLK